MRCMTRSHQLWSTLSSNDDISQKDRLIRSSFIVITTPYIFSNNSIVKQGTSSVGPISNSFRFQDHFSPRKTTRESRCFVSTFISGTSTWKSGLRLHFMSRHLIQVFLILFDGIFTQMILLRLSQPTLVQAIHFAPHCKGHLCQDEGSPQLQVKRWLHLLQESHLCP